MHQIPELFPTSQVQVFCRNGSPYTENAEGDSADVESGTFFPSASLYHTDGLHIGLIKTSEKDVDGSSVIPVAVCMDQEHSEYNRLVTKEVQASSCLLISCFAAVLPKHSLH